MSYAAHHTHDNALPSVSLTADQVLDHLLSSGMVTGGLDTHGQWRPATVHLLYALDPSAADLGWCSTNDTGHPLFTPYHRLCAALDYLVDLELVHVERHGRDTTRIQLSDGGD